MLTFRNPLVWLLRLPHRKGYGIHSPYAYNLVTQVLYSPGEYYADSLLQPLFSRWQRWLCPRRVVCHRLLFRLANHYQPQAMVVPEHCLTQAAYLHAGCRHTPMKTEPARHHYTLVTTSGTAVDVVYDLRRWRAEWESVRRQPGVTVTFDLYDMGIAVSDPKLNKQHYIINW